MNLQWSGHSSVGSYIYVKEQGGSKITRGRLAYLVADKIRVFVEKRRKVRTHRNPLRKRMPIHPSSGETESVSDGRRRSEGYGRR